MQSFLYKKRLSVGDVLGKMGAGWFEGAPFVVAISKGQSDDSIRSDLDVLYLRNFIQNLTLGLMQKTSTITNDNKTNAALHPRLQFGHLSGMILGFLRPTRV